MSADLMARLRSMHERELANRIPCRWRVGRTLGRTIYAGETCIGMLDHAEDAELLAEARNALPLLLEAVDAAHDAHEGLCKADPILLPPHAAMLRPKLRRLDAALAALKKSPTTQVGP